MNIEADTKQNIRVEKVPEQYMNILQSLFHVNSLIVFLIQLNTCGNVYATFYG
jgi:hypothetical protein